MTIYYVKTTGSNSNNGLTEATAFATPDYAFTQVPPNANHEIHIYSGTYEIGGAKSAPSGTKILGIGDINSRPTLQGTIFVRGGKSNVTIENLNLDGRSNSAATQYYYNGGISNKDCTNITIKNIKFRNYKGSCLQLERINGFLCSNLDIFDCTNNPKIGSTGQSTAIGIGVIQNGVFENIKLDTRTRGGQGFGMSDDGTNNTVMYWKNIIWRNCEIYVDRNRNGQTVPQMTIELQGGFKNDGSVRAGEIENCEIHSCIFNNMVSLAGGSVGLSVNNNRSCKVHHNLFYDKDEIIFAIEIIADNIEIYNNHIIGGGNYPFYNSDNTNTGIKIYKNIIELVGVENGSAPVTHTLHTNRSYPVKFVNNTIILANWQARLFYFGAGENAANEIKNNIFYCANNIGDRLNATTGVANNLFFNITTKGASPVSGNPLFSGTVPTALPASINNPTPISTYQLQSSSPARDTGVVVTGITPGGETTPDIGAIAFGDTPFAVGLNAFVAAANPDTPTIAVTSKTNNSITISIAKVGAQTVTQYGVAIKTSATGSFPADTDIAYSATSQNHTFTGLTASTTYNIQVRAKNAQGNSGYTQSLTETTNADATPVPEVPVITIGTPTTTAIPITITKGGATNVTAWDVAIKVVGASSFDNTDITYAANPQNHTFTGRSPNTQYVITVRGKNGTSAGAYSAQQTVTTQAEVPGVPSVAVIAKTSRTITIRITKSNVVAIEFYDVAIKYPGLSSYANEDIAYSASPQDHTFINCTPNGEHSILVRAKSGSQASAYSTEILETAPTSKQEYISLSNGIQTLIKGIPATSGVINAFELVATNQEGKIDDSFLKRNIFPVGDGASGIKTLQFKNQNEGNLHWNPTADFDLNLPNEDGTLEIVRDPRFDGEDYEPFNGGSSSTNSFGRFGLLFGSANGGSLTGGNHKRLHSGVLRIQTNTNAAGRASLGTASDTYLVGDRYWRIYSHVNPLFVATAGEAYTFFFGFAFPPASGNVPDRGIFFSYSQANANWFCRTRSTSSTETLINTNVPVVADAFYRLEFEVNATATEAIFKINDNIVGISTANFPNFVSDAMGIFWWIGKTAGTSNRFVDVDDLFVKWRL